MLEDCRREREAAKIIDEEHTRHGVTAELVEGHDTRLRRGDSHETWGASSYPRRISVGSRHCRFLAHGNRPSGSRVLPGAGDAGFELRPRNAAVAIGV